MADNSSLKIGSMIGSMIGSKIEVMKEIIIAFIKKEFTLQIFNRMVGTYAYYDRMRNIKEVKEFESYDQFIEHNIKCVNETKDDDIEFISKLIDRVSCEKLLLSDSSSFIEWDSCVIYFNKQKILVIMHPM